MTVSDREAGMNEPESMRQWIQIMESQNKKENLCTIYVYVLIREGWKQKYISLFPTQF